MGLRLRIQIEDEQDGGGNALEPLSHTSTAPAKARATPIRSAKMRHLLLVTLYLTILGCEKKSDVHVTSITDSDFRNAVRNGKVETVERFLESGYDIGRIGSGGENALQEGILHFDVGSLLIKRGINVNQQHRFDGSTPLIVACIAGNVEARTVKLLLDNGADPLLKDVNGKAALDYATQYSSEYPNREDTHEYDEKVALLTEAIRKKKRAEQGASVQPPPAPTQK